MHIKIETTCDVYDCETCGYSDANGANVYFDGELVLELTPVAHCYSGTTYNDVAIQNAILEKLGHTVEIV